MRSDFRIERSRQTNDGYNVMTGPDEPLRRDLDDLRRAGGLARHAVDAIRFPNHVGFVRAVLLPLFAALLHDLVVAGPLLPGGEEPLEHVDRADVHADAVRNTSVEVEIGRAHV